MKPRKTKKSENPNAQARALLERIRNTPGFAGADCRISSQDGHTRVTPSAPVTRQIHVPAEFAEREESGEKLTALSFSSEIPVRVWDADEILLHESGAANFTRLLEVGAILKNHNPAQIVGAPVRVWIDEKRRGNLAMRWGSTETALQAKKEALEDKTLRGVSVGYQVHEWIFLQNKSESYRGFTGPAWIAVKWDALEASLTPVPADPSVGLERSVRICPQAQNKNKTAGEQAMKRLKLLRAWKASAEKTYDAGVELEVDERTFNELTAGDDPAAEAVEAKREIQEPAPAPSATESPAAAPEARSASVDAEAIRKEARAIYQSEMAAEAKRSAGIRNICKRFQLADLTDDLIASGKSVEEAQRAILDKLAERQQMPIQTGNIAITKDGRDGFRAAAIDGLLLRSGVVKIEKPAEGADECRGLSLLDMARESLRRANIKAPSDVRKLVDLALNLRGSETISGTTSDFPYILAAGANKSLLAGYEVAPATFRMWARTGSLNDFKSTSRIRFSEVGQLELVPEGEKYHECARTEKRETIQLGTYGRTWTMSRHGIINDDLSAFTDTLFSFGMQAAMLPNDLGIAVLNSNAAMADGFELFSSTHANTGASTDRRLDTLAHATTALAYMIGLMAQQKTYQHADETARYLNLRPKVWLTSMVDMLIANQVVVSATDAGQDNAGVANAFRNLGITVVGDQNISTEATDYKHFLFADPRLAPVVEIAFLQGNQAPYFEEKDQTDADGRKWLLRLDCGAAAVDHVGAVREVGTK